MSKTINNTFALPLSQEDYAEAFKTYKKISGEWEAMFRWIQDKLLRNLSKKDYCFILSVGSGAGDFDLQFIGTFKEKFRFIEYVAVEPNDIHCQQFKTKLDKCSFPDFQCEICSVPFEEFNTSKYFDLIHFTHSLYYILDREQAILYALDMVADEGQILIFNQTPEGINQIQRMFLKRVKGDTDYMFSSKDLEKILVHHNISYQLDIIDSFLDITNLYDDIDSEFSQNLLNFFLESRVSQLAPTIRYEIFDYIKKLSFYDRGGRFIFHPVAIFSIFKKRGNRL
jgi:hypothetical protein